MWGFMLQVFVTALFVGIFFIAVFSGFGSKNHDYWHKRGIPYVIPLPYFGSTLDNLKKPLHQLQIERYQQLGPIHGFFEANTPNLTVGDPVLLRDIMVKDFPSFPIRRKDRMRSGDKVTDNMISIVNGEDWKRIRSIITPTFTTGKLKRMLSIFKECSETLVKNFKAAAEEGKPVDAKKVYGAFTMDVIASAAFSTKIDSHNDPENQFVKNARTTFVENPGTLFVILTLFPKLQKLFRLFRQKGSRSTNFFRDITLQIVEQRKNTGQVRNDFLQLLMDTAKEVSEEEKWEEDNEGIDSNYAEQSAGQQMFKTATSKRLSMDELVSQCVIFFLAGYETAASTLSFASYLLALNQDVQDKLREEVDRAIAETNGELTYETIQNMKYLDNVISETLRIFPPLVRLQRYADTEYKLKGVTTVPKGMCINIPVYALHRDPKHFPDPERFDPDRFTAEEKAKRDPFTYLPFGAGPRNCLGMRFALLEIKVCLSYILANFKIKRSPKTKDKLEFHLGVISGLMIPKEILVEMEVKPVSRLVN